MRLRWRSQLSLSSVALSFAFAFDFNFHFHPESSPTWLPLFLCAALRPPLSLSLSLWQLPVRASGFVFTTDKASCRRFGPSSRTSPKSMLRALSLDFSKATSRRHSAPAPAPAAASSSGCYYGCALQGSRTFKKIHGQERKQKQTRKGKAKPRQSK